MEEGEGEGGVNGNLIEGLEKGRVVGGRNIESGGGKGLNGGRSVVGGLMEEEGGSR